MTVDSMDRNSKQQVEMKSTGTSSSTSHSTTSRRKTSWIQFRYVLITLGFFGLASVYGMRVNLNVAMVAMVNQTAMTKFADVTGDCPLNPSVLNGAHNSTSITNMHRKDGPFLWDHYTQGLVLGAFYYGYIITPIPGGRLAEKYGAKWLFGCGTLITALLSLLIPVSAFYGGASGLIVVRVLQGLGEGVTFPAIEAQVAHWIPVNQRATAISLIHTGGFFGVAIGMYISGVLSNGDLFGGWPAIFYLFGIATAVWFVLWALFTSNRPDDHPWISQEELDLIVKDLGDQKPVHAEHTPWRKIFTSPAVFGVVCAHFGTHWLQYILVTELPTYLGTVLNFNIQDNGLYSALPYLGAILAGAISGPVSDYMRKRGCMSGTNIRKLFNGLAHAVPSIMLISVVWVAGCDGGLSLVLFVLAGTVRGASEAGYMSIPVDMAPDYAGTILGICVCVGNTTGFLVPWITGALIQIENSTRMWSYNFYLAGAIGLFTGLMFQLFASAEVQDWGLAASNKSNEDRQMKSNSFEPSRSPDVKKTRDSEIV